MKLAGLTTYVCDAFRTNWVFVKVESDDGLHGWGEATLEYREPTIARAVEELGRGLADRELADIQGWWQDAYRDAYWRGGAVLTTALSAVEMALWDLKGKHLGVPVYELLGGRVRDEVPCYANGWFTGARTPEEFARAAAEAVAHGYGALKWDPFGSAFRTIEPSGLRRALAVVEAVRAEVGDATELIVEAHGRFDLPAAERIVRALEPYDILWVEEPLIPGNLENYRRLRDRSRVPISLGERLYTRWDFREVFQSGCADIVQPDVSHAGGLWETRTIGAIAELWQTPLTPHNPSGPVANAATMQLAACTPNFGWLETMATDVPWRSEVAVEHHTVSAGRAVIGDAPGLGVDIDEEALRRHPYRVHELRHYAGTLTDIRPADAVFRGTVQPPPEPTS